ncbi:hypothetical protein CPSG_01116 [Coccidioides posadasii str. Silveira]|uniref:Uncharacterized protein n=1 Tax=Coccidioides posadasii (strain RMSCC 757 / Silveira) TaxID=443226 RepID=E9CR85_COCPS|nr:hypothetical protein CPSG_01116 [Coccidioides posadasii str. Silveira]
MIWESKTIPRVLRLVVSELYSEAAYLPLQVIEHHPGIQIIPVSRTHINLIVKLHLYFLQGRALHIAVLREFVEPLHVRLSEVRACVGKRISVEVLQDQAAQLWTYNHIGRVPEISTTAGEHMPRNLECFQVRKVERGHVPWPAWEVEWSQGEAFQ